MLLWQIYVPKKDELKFYYLSFFLTGIYCTVCFRSKQKLPQGKNRFHFTKENSGEQNEYNVRMKFIGS